VSFPTAQGLTATFGGTALGAVRGFDQEFAAVSTYDTTGPSAIVTGTGANTRVIRQLEVTVIDAGRVSFRVLGNPVLGRLDVGLPGTLSFTVGGVTVSGTAFLAELPRSGNYGGLIESGYTFQFNGAD